MVGWLVFLNCFHTCVLSPMPICLLNKIWGYFAPAHILSLARIRSSGDDDDNLYYIALY